MNRFASCRSVLLAAASVLVLAGCPLPIPPLGYPGTSRDNLPERVPEFIVTGKTTRAEVLLGLGVPDAFAPDERWFAYRSERHTGGVIFVVAGGYRAGGAGVVGYAERLLMVHFDEQARVIDVTLESRVCPRGVVALGSAGEPSSGCLKLPDAAGGASPEVLALSSFYVPTADAGTRDIERLIVAEFRRHGLDARTGPASETPAKIDAIVTYRSVPATDPTEGPKQLNLYVRAPGSDKILASAAAHRSSSQREPDMVAEAVSALLTSPGGPFLTLPPYEAASERRTVAAPERATVRIEPVRDARIEARGRFIGERTALGMSLGRIDMLPMPVDMIGQLLRTELALLGHRSGENGAQLRIDASLRKFDVRTPSTLTYWDVNGTIAVDLIVTRTDGTKHEFRYEATCTDRTCKSLSESVIKGVVTTCLARLGAQLREDRALALLLSTDTPPQLDRKPLAP